MELLDEAALELVESRFSFLLEELSWMSASLLDSIAESSTDWLLLHAVKAEINEISAMDEKANLQMWDIISL